MSEKGTGTGRSGGARAGVREARVGALRVAPRRSAITQDKLRVFFDRLAQTANVANSLAEAGIDRSGAYQRRRSDPAFKQLWDDTLDEAADHLAAEVLKAALESVSGAGGAAGDGDDGAPPGRPFDPMLAIKTVTLLDARQKRARGEEPAAMMPIEDVRRILLRRITAVEKRLARG